MPFHCLTLGHRWTVHRLGEGSGLRKSRIPDRRGPLVRRILPLQTSEHGRPRDRGHGRRAAPLRNRRSEALHPSRRRLRLHRRQDQADRNRRGQGERGSRVPAHRHLQSLRDLSRRLQGHGCLHRGRR